MTWLWYSTTSTNLWKLYVNAGLKVETYAWKWTQEKKKQNMLIIRIYMVDIIANERHWRLTKVENWVVEVGMGKFGWAAKISAIKKLNGNGVIVWERQQEATGSEKQRIATSRGNTKRRLFTINVLLIRRKAGVKVLQYDSYNYK